VKSRTWQILVIIVLACIGCFSSPASATVYYVDVNVVGGSQTGFDWANAWPDLQTALNNMLLGANDKIFVAEGTYKPGTTRASSFILKSGVAVLGGFQHGTNPTIAQRNPTLYPTILSGDIGTANVDSDNCYHVVRAIGPVNKPNPANVGGYFGNLDGFTITGGNATGATSSNGGISGDGGGIYIAAPGLNGSVAVETLIQRCRITDCKCDSTGLGGGIFITTNTQVGSGIAKPAIVDCRIDHCRGAVGGGVGTLNAHARLISCRIDNNRGDEGGGVGIADRHVEFLNCLLNANISDDNGGGVWIKGGYMTFTNCTLSGNTAVSNGAGSDDEYDNDADGVSIGTTRELTPDIKNRDRQVSNAYNEQFGVDMGAFEKPPTSTCPLGLVVPGDCFPLPCLNGVVNIDDLIQGVINHWGPCPVGPTYCQGDVFDDPTHPRVVNIDDLVQGVINHWTTPSNPTCFGTTYSAGSITSVLDCMNAATNADLEPYSPEWTDVVNKCVAGLCAAHIIECD
jgi:hypothetical protein